jgi:hypothetical protein
MRVRRKAKRPGTASPASAARVKARLKRIFAASELHEHGKDLMMQYNKDYKGRPEDFLREVVEPLRQRLNEQFDNMQIQRRGERGELFLEGSPPKNPQVDMLEFEGLGDVYGGDLHGRRKKKQPGSDDV